MTIQFDNTLTLRNSAILLLIVACGVQPAVAQECCEIGPVPTTDPNLAVCDNFSCHKLTGTYLPVTPEPAGRGTLSAPLGPGYTRFEKTHEAHD